LTCPLSWLLPTPVHFEFDDVSQDSQIGLLISTSLMVKPGGKAMSPEKQLRLALVPGEARFPL
jgi:hypothetical protein